MYTLYTGLYLYFYKKEIFEQSNLSIWNNFYYISGNYIIPLLLNFCSLLVKDSSAILIFLSFKKFCKQQLTL